MTNTSTTTAIEVTLDQAHTVYTALVHHLRDLNVRMVQYKPFDHEDLMFLHGQQKNAHGAMFELMQAFPDLEMYK